MVGGWTQETLPNNVFFRLCESGKDSWKSLQKKRFNGAATPKPNLETFHHRKVSRFGFASIKCHNFQTLALILTTYVNYKSEAGAEKNKKLIYMLSLS